MKINVEQIRQAIGDRQSFHLNCPIETVCGDNETFWVVGKIVVDGVITNTGNHLSIQGGIKVTTSHSCNRCLKDFEGQMDIPFVEIYRELDGTEPSSLDDDISGFQGSEIDLTELIRETLLLAEPIKTLCSENCLGLCPKCGADRNQAPCSCDQFEIDPRLEALKQFLEKK
jgi:uncharacterized protein